MNSWKGTVIKRTASEIFKTDQKIKCTIFNCKGCEDVLLNLVVWISNGAQFFHFRCELFIWKNKQDGLDGWRAHYSHLHYSYKWNMQSPEEFQQVYLLSLVLIQVSISYFIVLFCAIGAICVLNRMKLHLYLYFPHISDI